MPPISCCVVNASSARFYRIRTDVRAPNGSAQKCWIVDAVIDVGLRTLSVVLPRRACLYLGGLYFIIPTLVLAARTLNY